jgi:ureidoglycolate lyase
MAPRPERLTPEAFAPFGQVITPAGARSWPINAGSCVRFHDLAALDPGPDGRVILSLFRAQPRPEPLVLVEMERHPLGSQAFLPVGPVRWLVVVAPTDDPRATRIFEPGPGEGVLYAPNTWHHPLIVLGAPADFWVLDREGPGENCEVVPL